MDCLRISFLIMAILSLFVNTWADDEPGPKLFNRPSLSDTQNISRENLDTMKIKANQGKTSRKVIGSLLLLSSPVFFAFAAGEAVQSSFNDFGETFGNKTKPKKSKAGVLSAAGFVTLIGGVLFFIVPSPSEDAFENEKKKRVTGLIDVTTRGEIIAQIKWRL